MCFCNGTTLISSSTEHRIPKNLTTNKETFNKHAMDTNEQQNTLYKNDLLLGMKYIRPFGKIWGTRTSLTQIQRSFGKI